MSLFLRGECQDKQLGSSQKVRGLVELKFPHSPTPDFKQDKILKVEFQKEAPHSTPDWND